MIDKELFKSIFCHRPDWRYQLAKEFAGRPYSKLPVKCPLVNDCRAFLRKQARSSAGTSPRRNPRLPKKYQPLCAAFEIYCNAAYEQLKIEVEARILAKQSNDEIALATELPEYICDSRLARASWLSRYQIPSIAEQDHLPTSDGDHTGRVTRF
jgi:hypothetical protein